VQLQMVTNVVTPHRANNHTRFTHYHTHKNTTTMIPGCLFYACYQPFTQKCLKNTNLKFQFFTYKQPLYYFSSRYR